MNKILSLFLLLPLALSSCETLDSDPPWYTDKYTTDWKRLPLGCPGDSQMRTTEEGGGGQSTIYADSFYIRNTSSEKIHIVGLVSYHSNANFIDLEQPGAFNLTLYPGEEKFAAWPDGERRRPAGQGTTFLKHIQDWTFDEQ